MMTCYDLDDGKDTAKSLIHYLLSFIPPPNV
jgi:hypothetical protein